MGPIRVQVRSRRRVLQPPAQLGGMKTPESGALLEIRQAKAEALLQTGCRRQPPELARREHLGTATKWQNPKPSRTPVLGRTASGLGCRAVLRSRWLPGDLMRDPDLSLGP